NNINYTSFDYLYDELESFDEVYDKIVEILIEKSNYEDINYFVPGAPLVAEKTVKLLIEKGIEINIVNGISFIEPVLKSVGRDAVNGLLFLDSDAQRFDFDTSKDILITQVYNNRIASDLSLNLQESFKDTHLAYVITDAGLDTEEVIKTEIYKLPRLNIYNHQSCVYVPKSEDIDFNKILRKLYNRTQSEILDQEIFNKIKNNRINLSSNVEIEGEDEINEIIVNCLSLLFLKDREGIINFRDNLVEINKKLDKIQLFLK
ncbi:tetrapyrrole methylase, partial [Ignatzschineria cameli]|uniref:SAM-dependent methyltransferase n=1 Tax=Ignatzschineria cameli TaxID=2182793 RepID=UPI000D6125C6